MTAQVKRSHGSSTTQVAIKKKLHSGPQMYAPLRVQKETEDAAITPYKRAEWMQKPVKKDAKEAEASTTSDRPTAKKFLPLVTVT
jgi:hypothetical protein